MEKDEFPFLEDWITVSLAAEMLEVRRQTVHDYTRNGTLKQVRRVRSAGQDDPVLVSEVEVRQLAAKRRRSVVEIPVGS